MTEIQIRERTIARGADRRRIGVCQQLPSPPMQDFATILSKCCKGFSRGASQRCGCEFFGCFEMIQYQTAPNRYRLSQQSIPQPGGTFPVGIPSEQIDHRLSASMAHGRAPSFCNFAPPQNHGFAGGRPRSETRFPPYFGKWPYPNGLRIYQNRLIPQRVPRAEIRYIATWIILMEDQNSSKFIDLYTGDPRCTQKSTGTAHDCAALGYIVWGIGDGRERVRKKAIDCLRVSTLGQGEEGGSLDSQRCHSLIFSKTTSHP